METWKTRTELLIGQEGTEKLSRMHVLQVGLGGVGAFSAEMPAEQPVDVFVAEHFLLAATDGVRHGQIRGLIRHLPPEGGVDIQPHTLMEPIEIARGPFL